CYALGETERSGEERRHVDLTACQYCNGPLEHVRVAEHVLHAHLLALRHHDVVRDRSLWHADEHHGARRCNEVDARLGGDGGATSFEHDIGAAATACGQHTLRHVLPCGVDTVQERVVSED